MNYTIVITVHNYCEGGIDDRILVPHSKNYGINGKDIISPLRKINGREYHIKNVSVSYSVQELWDWIDYELWKDNVTSYCDNLSDFVKGYNLITNFLVFNNFRYHIDDTSKPLLFYLSRMGESPENIINVQLLIDSNAGELYKEDGIRYYMPSKEKGKHNIPHVHVDIHHDYKGTFSLKNGEQLSGDKFKAKDFRKIRNTIMDHQKDWLKYWDLHTDGLTIDPNQMFGDVEVK